jgi:hypothetical protein
MSEFDSDSDTMLEPEISDDVGTHDEEKKLTDGSCFKLTPSEERTFKDIDRDKEDQLVRKYQVEKDPSILEDLYALREPTLKIMARKFAWIDNADDMFGDFRDVWLKCVSGYEFRARPRPIKARNGTLILDENGKVKMRTKRTPFNTYLYTSMLHKAWNILKKKHGKKVLDDFKRPIVDSMRSLDYEYGDGSRSLRDTIGGYAPSASGGVLVEEAIQFISAGDTEIAGALKSYIDHTNLKRISTACRVKSGILWLSECDKYVLLLGGKRSLRRMQAMIRSTGRYGKFKLLNFLIYPSKVQYEIFVGKNHSLSKRLNKAISRCQSLV